MAAWPTDWVSQRQYFAFCCQTAAPDVLHDSMLSSHSLPNRVVSIRSEKSLSRLPGSRTH